MDVVLEKTLEWLEFEREWKKLKENLHEMNTLIARNNLDAHIEVDSSKEAYKRMEERELLYTSGIGMSEAWYRFVKNLPKTCKNCCHMVKYENINNEYICYCGNKDGKYYGLMTYSDWTCDCFKKKGETDGNSIMDNSSMYGD